MRTASLMALLGAAGELPQRVRKFRSVSITLHHRDSSARWVWQQQNVPNEERCAALVFLAGSGSVVSADTGGCELSDAGAAFLHPGRAAELVRSAGATAICAWLPWDALAELDDGRRRLPSVVPDSPLVAGLRSFAVTIATRDGGSTQHSDYLIERLVAEMVFGALLEASDATSAGSRQAKAIDRARTAMLLRRDDSSFGIEDVARELHLSTRQLQRIFAKVGSSPSDELRRLRVDLAHELLTDPLYDPLSVEDVAAHAGFTGGIAMRRAFAAVGLPSPHRARGTSSR